MTKTNEKKQHVTRKPIKISERKELVDPATGELIDQYIIKIEDRDANFHKLWLWHIASALELIGNQKIKILSHILESMNTDNLFIGTNRAIAEKTETSTKTVNITLKMLMEADILRTHQQAGVYLINPDVIFRGGTNKRMDILYQYYQEELKPKPKKKGKEQP